jgi:glycine/D-amino acid oxidase-like deaminating enzyme
VLALEAWATELKEFRRDLVVISADALMTEPIPEQAAGPALLAGAAMSDSRVLLNAFRMTRGRRLNYSKATARMSFGGSVGKRFDGPSSVVAKLRSDLTSFYPKLRDIGFACSWRGPVTRTQTGLPLFGRLPKHPNILFAHGYSGSGVGPSFVAGRVLASLALVQNSKWLESSFINGPLSLFPREPIRYIGGMMVRGAIARRERAEDVGRKASAIDKMITQFAPAGLNAPADK